MAAFTLDTNAARAGSDGAGGGITESGEYVGRITEAKKTTAGTGSTGVEFTFEDRSGATVRYLRLYTHDASGSPMAGLNALNAVMTCAKVREVSEAPGATPSEPVYPELCRPIGLVLRKELYTKKDGTDGYSMTLHMPFDPQTRRTAKEVLDDAQPATVDRIVASLTDNDRRKARPAAAPAPKSPIANGTEFEDDIPF